MRKVSLLAVMGMARGVSIPEGSLTECKDKRNCLVAQVSDFDYQPCEFRFENLEEDVMKSFRGLDMTGLFATSVACLGANERKRSFFGGKPDSQGTFTETEDGRTSIDCFRGKKKLGSYISNKIVGGDADALCGKFRSVRHQVKEDLVGAAAKVKKRETDRAKKARSDERWERIFDMFADS